jgi:hypothetical protein
MHFLTQTARAVGKITLELAPGITINIGHVIAKEVDAQLRRHRTPRKRARMVPATLSATRAKAGARGGRKRTPAQREQHLRALAKAQAANRARLEAEEEEILRIAKDLSDHGD